MKIKGVVTILDDGNDIGEIELTPQEIRKQLEEQGIEMVWREKVSPFCTCERPKMDANAEYPNYCLCGKPLPKPEPKPVEVSNCNLKVPEKLGFYDQPSMACKINEILDYLKTKG